MLAIYGYNYSQNEKKKSYISIIHQNLFKSIQELAKKSSELPNLDEAYADCKIITLNGQKSLQYILDMKYAEGTLSTEFLENIKLLWADPGLRNTFNNRSKFQVTDSLDSAAYFLNKIDEIAKPTYIPSNQDIMRCASRTTGIIENCFVIDRNRFIMIDVSGQRNDSKKWLPCFENVAAILFVVNISAYDRVLYEDEKVNHLVESLNLFENLCSSKWFRENSIILFLNKSDIFKEKIKNIPLTVCFPDYEGENTYEAGITFFGTRISAT